MRVLTTLLLGACLALTAACGGGGQAAAGGNGPTDAEIRQTLGEGQKADPAVNRLTITTINSITRGQKRLGDQYKDGVPANKSVTVYPIKVDITTEARNINTKAVVGTNRETRTASFWRDDYGQ